MPQVPTGYLHIGSARTALFNYLYARNVGGKFLLRVEDTDQQRSTEESLQSILDGLKWLGFAPDEEIVFQSANADKHRAVALKLLEEGKAYRDFTPKAAPDDKNIKQSIADRARANQGVKNMRDNEYRDLSKEESDANEPKAENRFAIRLKVAETGKTSFEDAVYGLNERDYSETEDLVLLRSDGHPLYNLAVVCDDIEMEITDVIRGQDHLTNTHKQILDLRSVRQNAAAFRASAVDFSSGRKETFKAHSRRDRFDDDLPRRGIFCPKRFATFLALLGWSAGEEQEIYTLDELVEKFSLDRIHQSNATFNFDANNPKRWTDDKAIWMNAEYIRTMPLEQLLPYVKTEMKAAKLWREEYEDEDKVWFEKTIDLIRERFFTLKDFSTQGRAYFSEDYDFDEAAINKNLKKFPDLKTGFLNSPNISNRSKTGRTIRSTKRFPNSPKKREQKSA